MKQIIRMILVAIIFNGCSNNDTFNEMNGDLIPLSVAGVSAQTKANTIITAENAQMGIFLLGANEYKAESNVVYQYNASLSKWNAANAATQIVLSSKPATICAYYPYASGTFDDAAAPTSVSLVSQKYDLAKDLSYSKSTSTATNTSPELFFEMSRAYAKLTFKITRDEFYRKPCHITNVTLANADLKSSSRLDIATGTYSADVKSSINYDPEIASIESKSTVTSSVLMVPVSEAMSGDIAISFTIDGKLVEKKMPVSFLNLSKLDAGVSYIIPTTISDNGLFFSTATTTDWMDFSMLSNVVEESNCYLLKPNGCINIPVSRVNSAKAIAADYVTLPSLPSSWNAELLWTDKPSALTDAGTIASITSFVSNGCIQIKAGNAEGNAVVCIKDNEGRILWSWHIWVTNTDFSVSSNQNILNNKITMDRNLGALTNTPATETTLGLLYQWGRKDPFPGSASVSNGEEPILYKDGGQYTLPTPISAVSDGLVASINNPSTFFYGIAPSFDWYSNSETQKDDLWGVKKTDPYRTEKTVFDPCPTGWRVPFDGELQSLGNVSMFSWLNKGYTSHDVDYNMYYPAAGCRNGDNGILSDVGLSGSYWDGLQYEKNARYLNFTENEVSDFGSNHKRANGFSIRCVEE